MKRYQQINIENEEDLSLAERAFEKFLIEVLNVSHQGQINMYLNTFRKIKEELNQETEVIE